jgi:uncharacterized membrane protein (UPF0127 family)
MLVNQTRQTVLSEKLTFLKHAGKVKGLLGKTKPETIVFETRFGIHTFFLKFPIDLLVLNNKRCVVLARSVKPNRMIIWNPLYKIVIELPAGTIRKSATNLGDLIKL